MEGKMPTRAVLNIKIPLEDRQALKELAERRSSTMVAVLRQAIQTEAYFDEQVRQGATILIKKGDETREILFR
jgi:hypothetical protein